MATGRRDTFDDDEPDDAPAWRDPDDPPNPITDRDDPLPGDMDEPVDDEPAYDTCPYCKKLIHEDADVCNHCHSFVHFDSSPATRPWWVWAGAGLALLGVVGAALLCATLWLLR